MLHADRFSFFKRLSGVDTSSLKNALAGRTSQAGPPPAYNKVDNLNFGFYLTLFFDGIVI